MSLRQLTLWKIERGGGKAGEEGSGDNEKEIIMRAQPPVREWECTGNVQPRKERNINDFLQEKRSSIMGLKERIYRDWEKCILELRVAGIGH